MTTGVINIYKEKGYTSFHAVAVLRHITGEKKIGHTGTLDPDAEGVLPVCIGKATKLVGQLTDTDKTYHAEMIFGKKTDTQDISGNVLEEKDESEIKKIVSAEKIKAAFKKLTGDIVQIPPMYSAIKINGVKLVDAARKGKVLEREGRNVTVYGYEDIDIDLNELKVSFTVSCSKGTYIRTICEDIGNFIGVPSCLTSLTRTKAAGLGIDSAITLDRAKELAGCGELEKYIIPTDTFLMEHKRLTINDDAKIKIIYGNYLYSDDIADNSEFDIKDTIYRMYDADGFFYALYRYDIKDKCFKCEKMFS